MNIQEYLKHSQPIVYQIFFNSLKNNNFAHATLLSSSKGSSLDIIAKYLAKSLICDNELFACETCPSCIKIEKGSYGDFLIFDAKNKEIKVSDIKDKIEYFFSKTGVEKKGIKIYVILNIEYLGSKASNMLLKFLEEPPKNTYAIFTTENQNRILPTILSRCEIIRFSKVDKDFLIAKASEIKGNDSNIPILSYLFDNYKEIVNNVDNPLITNTRNLVLEYIQRLNSYDETRYFIETKLLKEVNNVDKAYYFYDIFVSFLVEARNKKLKINYLYKGYTGFLDTLIKFIPDLDEAIKILLEDEAQIGLNVNLNLLIIHSLTKILKNN